jgi:hypothetical protein
MRVEDARRPRFERFMRAEVSDRVIEGSGFALVRLEFICPRAGLRISGIANERI